MRNCKKCGKRVPRTVWIDGKQRNCGNRKYCLECSPFGQHNTRKLEAQGIDPNTHKIKSCVKCGKPHTCKGRHCFNCNFNVKKQTRLDKVSNLIGGYKCCNCGYDKCKRNICFHHVHPEDKLFGLSNRELILKWDKVWTEIQKCILLCSNCHGEVHDGIIPLSKIEKLWKDQWDVGRAVHAANS